MWSKIYPFEYVEGRAHSCKQCTNHVARETEKISTGGLRGSNNGLADLFNKAINVSYGTPRFRTMASGRHFGMDISCANCDSVIGWKSTITYNTAEKRKEGKYLLDRTNVAGPPDA